jgi:hypothetical protein
MTETMITCPHCMTEFKLTESLAAPLIEATRRQYQAILAEKEESIGKREAAIRERQTELAKAQESVDQQVASKLKGERARIAAEEARNARLSLSIEIDQRDKQVADLQGVLQEREAKLAEAQKAQAELIRKRRELDDATREMDLTIETKVQESLATVREKARTEAEEGFRLKVADKEQTIAAMQRQIEELKRKAEQGSQQLQGEVQEIELETLLRARFPHDTIQPVPKGEFGGDVLQLVLGPLGQPCGTILWESKRTKNWSDGWLAKLRGDQRAAKADAALLVSQALPKGVETFDYLDGVWVTDYRCAIPVAMAVRQSLVELAGARQVGEGQQTKMSMVYQYLTGPRFRQRVEAIVEKFTDMQDDLERERKTMTRLWAKREEQIHGVVLATAGMYGDLQGIAGKSLQEIDGLEMKLLEEGTAPV